MGNKFAGAATASAPEVRPFLQIITYGAPPSYYDGQDPLPITYDMVELYKYSHDGDGPIHEIRSGSATLDVFDKICDLTSPAAFNAWEWTTEYFGTTPHDFGLLLIKPSETSKKKSISSQQSRIIQISPEPHYTAKEKHEERCATFAEFIAKIKDILEPFCNEALTETRFPTCSHRHSSAFVDMEPIHAFLRQMHTIQSQQEKQPQK